MYKDVFGKEHRYPPPVGWAPKGVERFSADEDWAAKINSGLSLPVTHTEYRGPSRLTGVCGNCLEPLVTARHMLRIRSFAADEQPIDGGLYEIAVGAFRESTLAVALREEHSLGENFTIAKFVRWICGEWHVQYKDGISPLSRYGEILGVVVAVLPLAGCAPATDGHARLAACGNPVCASIDPNAATTLFNQTLASFTTSVISGPLVSQSIPAQSTAYTAIVTVVGDVARTSAGGAAQVWIDSTSTPTLGQLFNVTGIGSANVQRVTLQMQYAIPANTAATFTFHWEASVIGNFGIGQNMTFQVEVVKR